MSRIRRTDNRKEYERVIDDYITQGYKVKSRGEESTRLRESNYGSIVAHILIFIIFGWWTLGLANLLYLAYKYWTSEEVIVKIGYPDIDLDE